jgi:hypothetical protein
MHKLGYNDFDIEIQNKPINYDDYLNNDSIQLINMFYEKDFELFNYPKKSVSS